MSAQRKERRRAPRAPAHGTAIIHGDHGVLVGNIENLSLGGVLVSAASAPAWSVDDEQGTLDVELRFGAGRNATHASTRGDAAQGFSAIGHPVRIEPEGSRVKIAVAFDRLPVAAEDAIEDEVEAALGAARTRPVLIIDDDEPRRRRLASAIGARGMTPLVPRTPLEAIDLLSRARLHVAVCALADRFADIPHAELRAFLAEGFPWVRTLSIANEGHDDAEAELADRAHAIWHEAAEQMMPS